MNIRVAARNLLIISLIHFSSCASKSPSVKAQDQMVNIGPLTIEFPSNYHYISGRGVDTEVGYIINDRKDTFQVEYGYIKFIYRLFDYPPVVYDLRFKDHYKKKGDKAPGPDEVVYTNTPEEDNAEGVFLKSYYMYDTINGLIAKIVLPKKIGSGLTGVLFPDLPNSKGLSIYARNLDSLEHIKALRFFYNIRLAPKK